MLLNVRLFVLLPAVKLGFQVTKMSPARVSSGWKVPGYWQFHSIRSMVVKDKQSAFAASMLIRHLLRMTCNEGKHQEGA
ncbi:hypothetical protein CONLIGDRAFT_636182 [Coniochaeta ligniaria NRRL 30616]|uniref:Secreted protein n=1 Tax=Coniochaeta ligniaria NRRL 30616 TaxID=1408157 RepID=A0A1J7IC76_9PEZI|nr:hypothetical protein CONLIGDRAFT_636182 [Coniochaeta ligniaria NRRL 30616]